MPIALRGWKNMTGNEQPLLNSFIAYYLVLVSRRACYMVSMNNRLPLSVVWTSFNSLIIAHPVPVASNRRPANVLDPLPPISFCQGAIDSQYQNCRPFPLDCEFSLRSGTAAMSRIGVTGKFDNLVRG